MWRGTFQLDGARQSTLVTWLLRFRLTWRGCCKSGIWWPTSRGLLTRVMIWWYITKSDVSAAGDEETSLDKVETSSLCPRRSFSSFNLIAKGVFAYMTPHWDNCLGNHAFWAFCPFLIYNVDVGVYKFSCIWPKKKKSFLALDLADEQEEQSSKNNNIYCSQFLMFYWTTIFIGWNIWRICHIKLIYMINCYYKKRACWIYF